MVYMMYSMLKCSLGNFDPSGHQSNSKVLKTSQAPPGEQMKKLSVCMVLLQAESRNIIQFSQEMTAA